MSELRVKCPTCNKKKSLIQKKEDLPNPDIVRYFFECEHCGHKETIYYSDSELRKLIKQQQKTKNQVTKNSLKKIIDEQMQELREKYESSKC